MMAEHEQGEKTEEGYWKPPSIKGVRGGGAWKEREAPGGKREEGGGMDMKIKKNPRLPRRQEGEILPSD